MADNSRETEDNAENLRKANEELMKFARSILDASDSTGKLSPAQRDLAASSNKAKDDLKSMGETAKAAAKDFGKQMLNAGLSTESGMSKYSAGLTGAMKITGQLASNFGLLGNIINGTLKGLAVMTEMTLKQNDAMVKAYDDLAQVGGQAGLSSREILELGKNAGYSSQTLGTFTKNARSLGMDLIALGTTASSGIKAFGQMTALSADQYKQYNRLGLSQEKVTEMQTDYVKMMTLSGQSLSKSPKELQNASLKYIDSLNELAAITGLEVDKAKEAQQIAAQQENFNAYINKKSMERAELLAQAEKEQDPVRKEALKQQAAQIQSVIDAKTAFATTARATMSAANAAAMQESIATDGAVVLTESNAKFIQMGMNLDDMNQNLNNGVKQDQKLKEEQVAAVKRFNDQYGEAGYAYGKASRDLQETMGIDNKMRQTAAQNAQLLTEEGREQARKDIEQAQKDLEAKKKQADDVKEANAAQLELERNLRLAQDDLIKIFSGPITAGFKLLVEVTNGIVVGFRKVIKFVDDLTTGIGNVWNKAKSWLGIKEEAPAAPAAAPTTPGAPAAASAAPAPSAAPTTLGAPAAASAAPAPSAAPAGGAPPTITPGGAAMVPPKAGRKAPSGPLAGQAELLSKLTESGITDKRAQANILAQVKAESGGVAKSESLRYTPERLLKMFPKYFKDLADAEAVVAQGEEAIGNRIYGGRMGNTAEEGYKYRGRGLIQLTGKANYEKFGKLIGVDLVKDPDLANDPDIAQKLAVEYFKEKSKKFDLTDIAQVGKAVGYVDRGGEETAKRSQYAQSFMEQIPQAAGGGIFKGPDSGYLVEQHGMELTAPLNPESILMQLAKTPASETSKPSETVSAAATSGMLQNNGIDPAMFADFMEMMQTKFDEMIAKLAQSNETQDKLLTYSMV